MELYAIIIPQNPANGRAIALFSPDFFMLCGSPKIVTTKITILNLAKRKIKYKKCLTFLCVVDIIKVDKKCAGESGSSARKRFLRLYSQSVLKHTYAVARDMGGCHDK